MFDSIVTDIIISLAAAGVLVGVVVLLVEAITVIIGWL